MTNQYFIFPPSPRNANVNVTFGALTKLGGVLGEDFALTYDNTQNAVVQVSEELYEKWRKSQSSEETGSGLGVDVEAFNAATGVAPDAVTPEVVEAEQDGSTAASASTEPAPEPKPDAKTSAVPKKPTTNTRSGK